MSNADPRRLSALTGLAGLMQPRLSIGRKPHESDVQLE